MLLEMERELEATFKEAYLEIKERSRVEMQ